MAAQSSLFTPKLRQRLWNLLLESGQFDTDRKRAVLLVDLPPSLVDALPRGGDAKTDLLQIILAAAAFEAAPDTGTPPLLRVIENAMTYIGEGSATTEQLKGITAELLADQIRFPAILQAGSPPQPAVRAVAVTADGQQVVSWSADGILTLWENPTANPPGRRTLSAAGDAQDVTALATFQIAGNHKAVTAAAGNQLTWWDLQEGKKEATSLLPVSCATALAVQPDGERIVVGLPSGAVALLKYDPDSHEIHPPTFLGDSPWVPRHSSPISAIEVTADGLGISATRNSVRWWGLSTGRELIHFILPNEQLVAVALMPDGKQVLYSTGDNEVKIRNLNTDPLQDPKIRQLLAGDAPILSPAVAVSADGWTVVAGRNDGSLCVWDLHPPAEAT